MHSQPLLFSGLDYWTGLLDSQRLSQARNDIQRIDSAMQRRAPSPSPQYSTLSSINVQECIFCFYKA